MSHRLQVLIPEPLAERIRKAAQRKRQSTAAWIRHALEAALKCNGATDPLDRLAALDGPTGDIDQILAEIGGGRC